MAAAPIVLPPLPLRRGESGPARLGDDAYVTKQFSTLELQARGVRICAARCSRRQPTAVEGGVEGNVIDSRSGSFTRDGTHVHLTPIDGT